MGLRLIVSNIHKTYKGDAVIRDCSYSFEPGRIYALMGSNGSGKSTFLRLCCLLEEPDMGEINYFSGNAVLKKDISLRRRITLLLPAVGIFNATVFNNVAYGLKIRGMRREEIRAKAGQALEFVGLADKKNNNALTCSSGEKQRLGIARAIAIGPEILFLDEPTASVDSENTEIVENLILKLKGKNGMTIIMATHDAGQAERLAEQILFMRDGRLR